MELDFIHSCLLDSIPYPIVFVDTDHIIRYMNKRAIHFYCDMKGHRNLIGQSVFNCHNEASRERIIAMVERMKNHSTDMFIGVSSDNLRLYANPVRNPDGELIGYFERHELNLQK